MARIIDIAFIFLMSIMLSFTWCRYYVQSNAVCFIVASSVSIIIAVAAWRVTDRRGKRRKAKAVNAAKKERLLVYLAINEPIGCFEEAYKAKGYAIVEKDHAATTSDCSGKDGNPAEETRRRAFLAEKEGGIVLVGVCFLMRPMTIQDLVKFIRLSKALCVNKTAIFCGAVTNDVQSFAKKNSLTLYDLSFTAELLEECGLSPVLTDVKAVGKGVRALSSALVRKRSAQYFLSAVFLLLTSFIAFFPLYYIIFASALFFLSLYSRFNSRFNCTKAAGI